MKTVVSNRRATHDYTISETFEAGLVLTGSEVKSLRAGQGNLAEAFALIRDGEAWLIGATIAPYKFAADGGHVSDRRRKLLMHRREIDRLDSRVAQQGLALVPMKIYFTDGKAKIQIGLGKGKRDYDKRQSLKAKDQRREMDRARRHR